MGKTTYSFVKKNKQARATRVDFEGTGVSTDSHQGTWVQDTKHGGQNWIWWWEDRFPKNHPIITQHLHGSMPSAAEKRRLLKAVRVYRAGKRFRHRFHKLGVVPPEFAQMREKLGKQDNPWYPTNSASRWRAAVWRRYFATHRGQTKFSNPEIARAYLKYGRKPKIMKLSHSKGNRMSPSGYFY